MRHVIRHSTLPNFCKRELLQNSKYRSLHVSKFVQEKGDYPNEFFTIGILKEVTGLFTQRIKTVQGSKINRDTKRKFV